MEDVAEVRGEVKWFCVQESDADSSTGMLSPGRLILSQSNGIHYISCVFDGDRTPSRQIKVTTLRVHGQRC